MTDDDLARRHAERGTERLIFFSDAVVAIAITLVVLPLVDEAQSIGRRTVGQFFVEDFYGFLAAAISFASIASFWRVHHALFVRATGYSRLLVRGNLLWLAGIVFLPLATVLDVKQRAGSPGGTVMYILTLAFIMAVQRLLDALMIREGLLDDVRRRRTPREEAAHWVPVAILVLTAAAAWFFPSVGLYILFLLVFNRPIARVVRGRRAVPGDGLEAAAGSGTEPPEPR